MGGLFDSGYSEQREFQRTMMEQEKKTKTENKRREQASADRITRDRNYAMGISGNTIAQNLLAAANYLSANSQGDTTLSQESLLNLGGKLG